MGCVVRKKDDGSGAGPKARWPTGERAMAGNTPTR